MTHGKYPKRNTTATNPQILQVAREMSVTLTSRGVRHALIGGLAVGAYGYERATDDADFLLASIHATEIAGDSLGGEVEGKTVVVNGVDVDFLFPKSYEGYLEDAIECAVVKNNIPTISVDVLICMKLSAARTRDNGDVVELLKRGKVNVQRTIKYLNDHRPDLVEDFKSLQLQAQIEDD